MISSKPSQYIKGWVEFYKIKFKINQDVLIPRPETELLVDEVIRYLADHPERAKSFDPELKTKGRVEGSPTVLDIGTGSGNIAISIAKNSKEVEIVAIDISKRALKVARQNAKLHGVEDKISFIQSDLLTNVPRSEDICIIVTNLPYIPTERIPYLDSSVKDFEPKVALNGGQDGFELYRKLFSQISTLQPQGFKPKLIICEIDYTHGELAINEALKFFPNAQVEVRTDLAHKQRILKINFS